MRPAPGACPSWRQAESCSVPPLTSALGYGEEARKSLLRSAHVNEVMSEPAVTIAPAADLDEAIRMLLLRKIGSLPVVADGALLGLLSESDALASLLRA